MNEPGYAAFTTSFSAVGDVTRYIETQMEHHRRQSFEREYRALLDRHHMAYEEHSLDD